MAKIDASFVTRYLGEQYPNARCTLIFSSPFECLVAVMLSAQTSDENVNRVTPSLFQRFPTPGALAKASLAEVEEKIRSLGLFHSKALHLVEASKAIAEKYDGIVPHTKEELVGLPGVGVKTANVVLAECFGVPAIAVDTHVGRVSKRLGLARASDEPQEVEKRLEKTFPRSEWIDLHHRLIAFGRDCCHSRNPECARCGLSDQCPYFKKASFKAGK